MIRVWLQPLDKSRGDGAISHIVRALALSALIDTTQFKKDQMKFNHDTDSN